MVLPLRLTASRDVAWIGCTGSRVLDHHIGLGLGEQRGHAAVGVVYLGFDLQVPVRVGRNVGGAAGFGVGVQVDEFALVGLHVAELGAEYGEAGRASRCVVSSSVCRGMLVLSTLTTNPRPVGCDAQGVGHGVRPAHADTVAIGEAIRAHGQAPVPMRAFSRQMCRACGPCMR